MRTLLFLALLATLFLALLAMPAPAATVLDIISDPADGSIGLNGLIITPGISGNAIGTAWVTVFVFQLPTLTATQTIVDAALGFTVLAAGTSAELAGVNFRTLASLRTSDFFGGTRIAANVVSPGALGRMNVTAPELLTFLRAQQQNGATGGDFIFLRLTSPFGTTLANAYTTTGNGGAGLPVLTLTINDEANPDPEHS